MFFDAGVAFSDEGPPALAFGPWEVVGAADEDVVVARKSEFLDDPGPSPPGEVEELG